MVFPASQLSLCCWCNCHWWCYCYISFFEVSFELVSHRLAWFLGQIFAFACFPALVQYFSVFVFMFRHIIIFIVVISIVACFRLAFTYTHTIYIYIKFFESKRCESPYVLHWDYHNMANQMNAKNSEIQWSEERIWEACKSYVYEGFFGRTCIQWNKARVARIKTENFVLAQKQKHWSKVARKQIKH